MAQTNQGISGGNPVDNALRESEERLTKALTASRIIAWTWNLRSDAVTLSQNATDLIGLPTNVDVSTFWQIVHPDDVMALREAIDQAIAERGEYDDIDFRVRHARDGNILWLRARGKVECERSGEPLDISGTVREVTGLKGAEHELQNAKVVLENRVREHTTELEQANQSLRLLSAHVLKVQDEQRRKIASELHDSVGQGLAGLQMILELLAGQSDPKTHTQLDEALVILADTMREVRTISQLLHPSLLEVAGFVDAAKAYAEEFGRRSGIKVSTDLPEDVKLPSKDTELLLFRVLQESLTNVYRHAQASAVEISLERANRGVVLTVHDNGKGLPPSVMESFQHGKALGVGLTGKRERLAEFGGRLELESSGSGTTIRAILPM
jgi:PAS domain S-box-containing protein